MSNEAIAKMIDNIASKEFSKAGDDFEGLINSKLQDTLDQARTKIAGQIFEPQVGVEPDEELVAGEVTNDDLEAEEAANEVEAEIEAADEVELDDEEDEDDNESADGDDETGDGEEPEETSEEDPQ